MSTVRLLPAILRADNRPAVMKTHEEKLAVLRDLGELQGEMAQKAAVYRTQDKPELYMRFERASYAAVNARLFMQAALMAEREASAAESAP